MAWLDVQQVRVLSNRDRADLFVFAQVDRPIQRGDLDRLPGEKLASTSNSISC
jgi:hypothetical protein